MIQRAWNLFVVCAVALLFALQLTSGYFQLSQELTPVLASPNRSPDDRMRFHWGDYYDLMEFARRATPANAVILIGDKHYSTVDVYFLYPRRIVYGDATMLTQTADVTHILIDGKNLTFALAGRKVMLDATRGVIARE